MKERRSKVNLKAKIATLIEGSSNQKSGYPGLTGFTKIIVFPALVVILGFFTFSSTARAQVIDFITQGESAIYTNTVSALPIKGESILVQNLSTGEVLYTKNSEEIRPLASITKLMTAITVMKMKEEWKTLPSSIKIISNGQAYTASDRAVEAGKYMKLESLIRYMLLTSSNFAAYSIAHEIVPFSSFMAYMNFQAKNIGLTNSHFINASGLTEEGVSKELRNSVGTAEDVMKILETITFKYPELAQATRITEANVRMPNGQLIPIENTNILLDSMPDIFLGKTGYTDDAGGNLAVVIQRNNQYYGIVVLGSTIEDRFTDVAQLASGL